MLLLELAQEKRIPIEKLVQYGLEQDHNAVIIPYHDATGFLMARKRRTHVTARHGSYWPKDRPLMPYGLNQVAKLHKPFLILVEGESDCWSLWQHGFPGLGLPGANTAACLKLEHLEGVNELFIHCENDEGGEHFKEGVLKRLRELRFANDVFTFSVPQACNDINDFYRDHLGDFAKEFGEVLRQGTLVNLASTAGGIPGLVSLAAIEARPLAWLWPQRIPRAALTVLDGDPGLGKSTLALDLAARVSRGDTMPFAEDQPPVPAQRVLLLSGEDEFGAVVRPRLERAGACLERILVQNSNSVSATGLGVTFPTDLPLLEETVREHQIGLVIVDPLMAFFANTVDSNKDSDVRKVFHHLFRLTASLQTTVLIIRHLNKMPMGKALYRGGGSIGIIGASRSALIVGRDPEYPDKCLLAVNKSNYAALAPSIRYSINQNSEGPLLNWEIETGHEPEELLQARMLKDKQIDKALAFLANFLADGRFHSVHDIVAEAAKIPLHPKTLCRARDLMACQIEPPTRPGLTWHWALPLPEPVQPAKGA